VASNGAILDSKSPLILEGLEFHRPGGRSRAAGTPALVRVHRASLHVAHCRFVVRGGGKAVLVTCPADLTARNCGFEAAWGSSWALGFAGAGRSKVHLEQCVIHGGRTALDFTRPPKDMSVTLVNNTVWVTGPLMLGWQGPKKAGPAARSGVTLHASGNILYRVSPLLEALARGGDRPDAEQLPRGFVRLGPGRSAYGVGPGGTDLGADVERVGPGEAYQRWTKTPDYHEWRKRTNALIGARGGQPPAGEP
jgi:hypothetical protein